MYITLFTVTFISLDFLFPYQLHLTKRFQSSQVIETEHNKMYGLFKLRKWWNWVTAGVFKKCLYRHFISFHSYNFVKTNKVLFKWRKLNGLLTIDTYLLVTNIFTHAGLRWHEHHCSLLKVILKLYCVCVCVCLLLNFTCCYKQ